MMRRFLALASRLMTLTLLLPLTALAVTTQTAIHAATVKHTVLHYDAGSMLVMSESVFTGSETPSEPLTPSFGQVAGLVAAESGTVRVGPWMSQAEADAMAASGRVQAPLNGAGATHVTVPPNPAAFTPPASSSTFVEFNVPSSQLRIHDPGQGWGRIFGPDSIEARLAARQGLPVPTQMPPATQIQPTASAWPRRQ